MDFLTKLDYLMKINNLNKNKLSKSCDIPYTTIDGWYKKGYEGLKLTTLRKLATYFGTTLDYWANADFLAHKKEPSALAIAGMEDPRLLEIIDCYKSMNEDGRASLHQQSVMHSDVLRYKKDNCTTSENVG